MYSTLTLWIAASLSLIFGLGAGLYIASKLGNQAKRSKELEDQLAQAEKNLAQYRQQVISHFSKTSDLVNQLTDSYKEVHDHLRVSAVQLCNDEFSRHLLSITPPGSLSRPTQSSTDKPTDPSVSIEPPKDYAPKTDADETGMLNEEYGLEKVNHGESTKQDTLNQRQTTEAEEQNS